MQNYTFNQQLLHLQTKINVESVEHLLSCCCCCTPLAPTIYLRTVTIFCVTINLGFVNIDLLPLFINYVDGWAKILNSHHSVHCLFLDFTKAVPHERLLLKLWLYGVGGTLLNWFRCFLTTHRQRMVLNGSFSSWLPVISGVAQGAIFLVSCYSFRILMIWHSSFRILMIWHSLLNVSSSFLLMISLCFIRLFQILTVYMCKKTYMLSLMVPKVVNSFAASKV